MNNVRKPVYGKGAPLERAVKAALQDTADCPALPADFGLRVEAIVQMQSRSKGRGFMKIAASVAVCVSLAGFAAWQIAERVGGEGAKASESVPQAATPVAVLPEGLCCDNNQKTGEKSMNAIKKTAVLTATIAAAVSSTAHATVHSGVFDDATVWYRGADAGEAYYTNGPEGTFANNGGEHISKSFKSILHASDASHAFNNLKWAWGWGAETTLDSAPVVCPYANCTLTGVTYANRPIPANEIGTAQVTVNDQTTTQPVLCHWKGPEYLSSGNWVSGSANSYTIVLRLRVDTPLNNHAGSDVGDGYSVFARSENYSWNANTGLQITFNGPSLGTYRYPRIDFGGDRHDLSNAIVPYGNWVDIAIAVNGSSVTLAACAQGANGNTIDWKNVTLPDGVNASLPASGNTFSLFGPKLSGGYTACWTNGVKAVRYNSTENCMRTQFFRGAVHQLAFWNRALSADEIREAWGEGRPNLVRVGVEGNGVNEFYASTTSVTNGGAWQKLDPTLNADNTTASIVFDCPALWAGQAQWLRIPIASGNGALAASINGTTLGTVTAVAGGVGRVFVPANVITSGANTLVITRLQGSFAIDAVTLGGSWKFGESIGSFATAPNTPDQFVFNPAGGNDKFRDRTLNSGTAGTDFRFYVPSDLVGRVRGVFTTRVQNTGTGYPTYDFEFLANGSSLGTYGLKGGNECEIKVPVDGIVAGWNTFAWKRISGWANIDWHKFELQQPPKGMLLVVR